jgi:hypothetical protein
LSCNEKKESKGDKAGTSKSEYSGRFEDFIDVICYNCGTLDHHKANCKKPRVCFICKEESHIVKDCSVRKQGHKCVKYIGSAISGLGFYQIEAPVGQDKSTIDFTNCGKVYIEAGEITKEELQLELATCFNPLGHGRSDS